MEDVDALINEILAHDPKADTKLIRKAYDFSFDAHKDMKRISGESYFSHIFNVAMILAKLGFDDSTIAASLIHDIEETGHSLKDVDKEFGSDIAFLVTGLAKLRLMKQIDKKSHAPESLRKMLLAVTKDIRAVFIRLADKLDDMRSLDALPSEKRIEVANTVLDVYAPLAYRLGLGEVKAEFEDLAMKYLYPEDYKRLSDKVPKRLTEREEIIGHNISLIKNELKNNGIDASVKGRPKHLFSIFRKMLKYNKSFEEIYDVMAYRVIVDDVETCYKVLGIVHKLWTPMPNRFKDYIAIPKQNMYQSLHTTVIDDEGNPIEIQIRSKEMDLIAEEGIAAHWRYKGMKGTTKFDKSLSWLRQLLDWKNEAKSASEFVDKLKLDFFKNDIFCFTPKGDIIELPKGATVIDFAYAVHSEIGNKCAGAIVNNNFVPLKYEVGMGDVIEIVTKKNQMPSRSWLGIAKTSKALIKIQRYLRETTVIPAKRIVKKISPKDELKDSLIVVKGVPNASYKIAKCCNPLPGDPIKGYVTSAGLVTIHRKDCKRIDILDAGPTVKKSVDWKENFNSVLNLGVLALDRTGLLADILNTISSTGTHVSSAHIKMAGNDMAECRFDVEIVNLNHLRDLISRVKKVKDVSKVMIGDTAA
jgi:GTP pyrophosphokinase